MVRLGGTLVLCGNKVFLFGGFNKQALNDLDYIDPKSALW